MFVVKPLMKAADLPAFFRIAAASKAESILSMAKSLQMRLSKQSGRSETRAIVRGRMSAEELEVSRLDALAERELGP
jgi:hypothetical protein